MIYCSVHTVSFAHMTISCHCAWRLFVLLFVVKIFKSDKVNKMETMEYEQLEEMLNIEVKKFCLLATLYVLKQKENRKRKRSCAVRKLLQERRVKGYFSTLIPEMRLNDVQSFINFHRMDPTMFDELLSLIGPNLRKGPLRFEEEIGPSERLAITLRIGAATTSNIIRDMCALIWEKLQFVFPTPSDNMRKDIADSFEEKWVFPNCLGAIDGKHVVVQAFPNHNALTFDYKHLHSLILMAVADADYKFITVDIGSLGHNNDSSVFLSSRCWD